MGRSNARRARELREQERYARAVDASDDGFWDWTVADDSIYTSPRLLEIFGLAPDSRFGGRDDLLARLPFHPEDRPLLTRTFAEHLAGSSERCCVETRFVREDGETRWAQLAGKTVRETEGIRHASLQMYKTSSIRSDPDATFAITEQLVGLQRLIRDLLRRIDRASH